MYQHRLKLKKSVACPVVLCLLVAISLCSGCEPLPNNMNGNGLNGDALNEDALNGDAPEGNGDNGDPGENGTGDRLYPEYFEDPMVDYLGVAKDKILSQYGTPEDKGYYMGGYYLSYAQKNGLMFFFPSEFNDGSLTTSVWITRGKIMGVRVGDTFSEIKTAWGEPERMEYDEAETSSWTLSYSFPGKVNGAVSLPVRIVFFAESQESPTDYAFIKQE